VEFKMTKVFNQNITEGFAIYKGILTLDSDVKSYPDLKMIKKLISLGLKEIHATLYFIQFEPKVALRQVQLLRECVSLGVRICWKGKIDKDFNLKPFFHLPPPISLNASESILNDWRETYQFGTFFWRQGPEFIFVKDIRDPKNSAKFIIDDAPMISIINQCLKPTKTNTFKGKELFVEELIEEGILFECQDYILTLPYRIMEWPIPFDTI
jgi:hypothetical protein